MFYMYEWNRRLEPVHLSDWRNRWSCAHSQQDEQCFEVLKNGWWWSLMEYVELQHFKTWRHPNKLHMLSLTKSQRFQDMRDEDLGILSMMHGANITKSKAAVAFRTSLPTGYLKTGWSDSSVFFYGKSSVSDQTEVSLSWKIIWSNGYIGTIIPGQIASLIDIVASLWLPFSFEVVRCQCSAPTCHQNWFFFKDKA